LARRQAPKKDCPEALPKLPQTGILWYMQVVERLRWLPCSPRAGR